MAAASVNIIWGAGSMGYYPREKNEHYLGILEQNGVRAIDTAHAYPDSEKVLGELGAPEKFAIHTKAPAFEAHCLSRESILRAVDTQLELLGVDSVEIYYLHTPDTTTPIEETLEAINLIHKAGKIHQFGLSNFTAPDVQKIHSICAAKGYPLPTTYQGNYNPVARHIETDLLPLLRRLHISFSAYSPLAGGFLVKDAGLFASQGVGRWDRDSPLGQMYRTLYGKPAMLEALREWETIARDAGVGRAALAYRWVLFHSALSAHFGDACIVGATQTAQLEETMRDVRDGPLAKEAVDRIEGIWRRVEHEAPLDNYNSYMANL